MHATSLLLCPSERPRGRDRGESAIGEVRRDRHRRLRQSLRFVRFCNAFNIPLISFVDVPGFLPGVEQEFGGIIRHGAKMLFSFSAATVPKIIDRDPKGVWRSLSRDVCEGLGADRVAAWPTAEIAVMGAEGAVSVLYRNEIKGGGEPTGRTAVNSWTAYRRNSATPYLAAARGMVDAVIEPKKTRATCRWLSNPSGTNGSCGRRRNTG